MTSHFLFYCVVAILATAFQPQRLAADSSLPVIAIVIDDLGQQRAESLAVTRLPGPVACAVLPHTPWAETVADAAAAQNKEVLLHLPLQAMETDKLAGTGEISIDNSEAELRQILASDLASVPHVVGVNNHMGSLVTRHPGHMSWLMQALKDSGDLFFLDSYTTALSVAETAAREAGVASTRRHVFLDSAPGRENLEQEFARLVDLAKAQGFAVAIGHPYPETTAFLNDRLKNLEGVRLVSVSELIAAQAELQGKPDVAVAGTL